MLLPADEVHVWAIDLELGERQLEPLRALLCEAELVRAGRLLYGRHRRRFVAAHGALRRILAAYAQLEPAALAFEHGPHGKPALAPGCGPPGLRFNLAHSHELALVAVAAGRELGVDVEHVRPLRDLEAIARRFFSAREAAALGELPDAQRREAFFRCWTRKEAYLKALGDGLARPLGSFEVTLLPGEPARLVHVEGHPDELERWTLRELEPAPGYLAALAVEGQGARTILRSWAPGVPCP